MSYFKTGCHLGCHLGCHFVGFDPRMDLISSEETDQQ